MSAHGTQHVSQLRVLSPLTRELELAGEGWQRRFVGTQPRLDELAELYHALGLEVRLEPLAHSDIDGMCRGCVLGTGDFRVLYTRGER